MDATTALHRAHALAFDGHMAAAAAVLDRALNRAQGWTQAEQDAVARLAACAKEGARDLHAASEAALAARRMEGAHA